MSYEIKDTHHTIIINLDTYTKATSGLKLRTYINGGNLYHRQYDFSNGQFKIPLNSGYSVGDVITKFELYQIGSPRLWNTHEGVQILLNGVEVKAPITEDNQHYGNFTLNFGETGEYDLQAVYVGNGSNQVAKTEKKHFFITQETSTEESVIPQAQRYKLAFKDSTTPKLKYGETAKIDMILTYGGQPAPNKLIQKIEGDRDIDVHGTQATNKKGIVTLNLVNLDAGKWQIGGYYYDDVLRRTRGKTKWITISKLKSTLTDNFVADSKGQDTNFIKGSKYMVTLKVDGERLAGEKVDMYVNGEKKTKTTSKSGVVSFAFRKKDTYKIKTVYKGNKNVESVELTRTITISE